MYGILKSFAVYSKPFFCILFVLCSTRHIKCEVTKCCPAGFVLETSNYFCAPNNTSWDAYNIVPSALPYCERKVANVFQKDETYIELNGCVDKDLNDEFVTVSCPGNPIGVHAMKKCCPIGQSYDHLKRACVVNPNTHADFKNLFQQSAVVFDEKNAIPSCSDDEVFVEYFSTVHDIKFSGKNVQVNDDILSSDKFCIEDLINIDPMDPRQNGQHMIVRSCRPRSVCDTMPCIRRCCSADQVMLNSPKRCAAHPENANIKPIFYDLSYPLTSNQQQTRLTEYGILQAWKCKSSYPLMPDIEDDLHYLHKDGKLHMVGEEPLDHDHYCIENVQKKSGAIQLFTFLCFENKTYEQLDKFAYYPYGISISCIFLTTTLIVYLLVPKLLNLHGKTLVCYVLSFLAAYITLAILQFNEGKRSPVCYQVAFFLLYCFMAAFCWQSVMCFDIWLTFGSLRSSFMMRHNRQNRRKFFYYSAYAWLFPLVWILFTLYAEQKRPLPDKWNPNIGENTCFFTDDVNWRTHFLFFLMPAGVHVIANCILFVITAINCSRVKSDIHRMQCISDESNTSTKRKKFLVSRAIFIMNLKLFTVMGISWMLEFISTFYKNHYFEYILDSYNILLGVSIFFIFVFKRKVLYELKCRFGLNPRTIGSATPRSTTVTNTANVSMRDIRCPSEKNLPLLVVNATTLQVPSIKK
ncbi:G-protein coupled receptor Mth2 isoform X2 [Sitodiplosis mosellana]|uniref:G-protein coupled receptor Mth2 isoform X2 n=1 Tax=Sitodiplosis mosellana TaxID=263140 RepID=UPI002444EC1A|nr:G-protein coupled receptor Mth2 isoform X2 [Sitodiplosis mosellana]